MRSCAIRCTLQTRRSTVVIPGAITLCMRKCSSAISTSGSDCSLSSARGKRTRARPQELAPATVTETEQVAQFLQMFVEGVLTPPIFEERLGRNPNLFGNIDQDRRGNIGQVGQSASGKAQHTELYGKPQPIVWTPVMQGSLEILGTEREVASDLTFAQVGGNTDETLPLLRGQQNRRFGGHSTLRTGLSR